MILPPKDRSISLSSYQLSHFFISRSSIITFNKSYRVTSFEVIILSRRPSMFQRRLFRVRFSVNGDKQKRMQAKVGGGLQKREKEGERGNILAFLLLVLVPPGIFSCLSLKLTLHHLYIVAILIIIPFSLLFFSKGRRANILLHF